MLRTVSKINFRFFAVDFVKIKNHNVEVIMLFIRKSLIFIAGTLFRFVLFFSISITAIVLVYSDNQYIKNVLVENQVYDRFLKSLIETNKDQKISSGQSVKIGDPEIRKIILEAFPADKLKASTETVIDNTYSWLEGSSKELLFTIDLTENNQKLADGLSSFGISRLKTLPICTEYNSSVDPFSAQCQPKNFNFESEQSILREQLLSGAGLFENPIYTQDIITKNSQDNSTKEDIQKLPDYYRLAKITPFIAVFILTLLAVFIMLITKNKRYGAWTIGRALTSTGISVIIFTFIFSFVFPRFSGSLPILQTTGQGIDAVLNDTATDFGVDYAKTVIKVALPITAVGFLLVYFSKKREQKSKFKNLNKRAGIISSNEQLRKPTTKPREKPPIQSSESSDTKPARTTKSKKYRKIPKKEI